MLRALCVFRVSRRAWSLIKATMWEQSFKKGNLYSTQPDTVLVCSCSMCKQARQHRESSHEVWERYYLPTSEVCVPVLSTYTCRMHCSPHILNVPLLHDNLNKMSSLALMFWLSSHTTCLPKSCKHVLTFHTSQPCQDTHKLYKTCGLGPACSSWALWSCKDTTWKI